jgi:hypothetical protein
MGMFPDEFPFNREAQAEAPAQLAAEAQPAAAAPLSLPASSAPAAPLPSAADVHVPERRRSPRQVLTTRAMLRAEGRPAAPVAVEMNNISLLGVRFYSEVALDKDQRAQIRIEVGPLKWNSRLRVITCTQDDWGRYMIGCEFVGNELVRPWSAAA